MEEGWDRLKAAAYAWSHTAAPMLSGTLVAIIGFMPVGFARSTAGEYAGNIFWIVGYALIASWVVAVVFTPYLGVKLLPDIKPIEGGHAAIYATPRYERFRRLVTWAVGSQIRVAGAVVGHVPAGLLGMGSSSSSSFRVRSARGSGRGADAGRHQHRGHERGGGQGGELAKATAGGQDRHGLHRPGRTALFPFLQPELPDPSFAKLIVLTPDAEARERLKLRLREQIAKGLVPESRVRVTQLVFGPYTRFPVAFRVMGPDPNKLRDIANEVQAVMHANPNTRQVNQDWGERAPTVRFVLEQDRLRLIGLTSSDAAEQLQFLLTGAPVTQVREDIRVVEVVARSAGSERLDPARFADMTLTSQDGRLIPLSQVGHVEVRPEDPILWRRDRTPTITVQSDIDERLQPPQVSKEIEQALKPVIERLPAGYRIETGGNIEESAKANRALAPIFPIMIALTLLVIVVQVRSLSAIMMVFLTAPLGLVGAVPVLLLFQQPFGFNAILGLIGLSGILMRNTLILIGQIQTNRDEGLDPYRAVIEATVQRARPVILTALAAVLAFIPLTQSVFWGSMAYTLIGGTAGGTVLILIFLPALYAIWFRVRPTTSADVVPIATEIRAAAQ